MCIHWVFVVCAKSFRSLIHKREKTPDLSITALLQTAFIHYGWVITRPSFTPAGAAVRQGAGAGREPFCTHSTLGGMLCAQHWALSCTSANRCTFCQQQIDGKEWKYLQRVSDSIWNKPAMLFLVEDLEESSPAARKGQAGHQRSGREERFRALIRGNFFRPLSGRESSNFFICKIYESCNQAEY